jgi:hypothetical protein
VSRYWKVSAGCFTVCARIIHGRIETHLSEAGDSLLPQFHMACTNKADVIFSVNSRYIKISPRRRPLLPPHRHQLLKAGPRIMSSHSPLFRQPNRNHLLPNRPRHALLLKDPIPRGKATSIPAGRMRAVSTRPPHQRLRQEIIP